MLDELDPASPSVDDELSSQDDQPSSDDAASTDAEVGSGQSAADAQKAKAPRDPLAERTRELRQTQAQLGETNRLLNQTMSQVNMLVQDREAQMTAAQKQRHANRMADIMGLPPEKQVAELIKVVDTLTAPKDPPKAPAATMTPQQMQDAINARAREHLQRINTYYGLDADNALTGEEEELEGMDNEHQWFGAAVAMAKAKKKQEGTQVPKNELETLRARVAELEGTKPTGAKVPGASKPNNVQSIPRKGPANAEDLTARMDKAMSGYKPKLGVKAVRKQLEESRDRLKELAGAEAAAIS